MQLCIAGNDICKDAKRQIISIEDVFTALEDLEFTELLPALKESLEGTPLLLHSVNALLSILGLSEGFMAMSAGTAGVSETPDVIAKKAPCYIRIMVQAQSQSVFGATSAFSSEI